MKQLGRSVLSAAVTAVLAAMAFDHASAAGDVIKIGYITTLTTPASIIGRDQQDAVNLALDRIGETIAGKKVQVIFEDDGTKPDLGRQKAEKLLMQDHVDLVGGFIWTNVLLAAEKPILDAGKILISNNAGPSQFAGNRCHENFFSTFAENDMLPRAVGEAMNKGGIKKLYTMAPNYIAGKEQVSGVLAAFKGSVVGSDYTKWGADPQLDFSAELAKVKASGADTLFAFYPGAAGIAFVKQFAQSGLAGTVELYSTFTIDQISLPVFQSGGVKAVLGSHVASDWSPNLDNPANKEFVEAFKAKYGRLPSNYAATAYDFLYFVKAAIEQSGGDVSNTRAVSQALRNSKYPSVRGAYKVGNNGYPILRFYSQSVVDGPIWTTKVDALAMENTQDPYAKDCPLH